MLQTTFIKTNRERVIQGLVIRNWDKSDAEKIVNEVISADDNRKQCQTRQDQILAQINAKSKEIGMLFKTGKQEEAGAMKSEVGTLKQAAKEEEEKMRTIKNNLEVLLLDIPNVPHKSVPAGKLESDNEIYQAWKKEFPDLGANALPHWELAEKYNLIDFKLGVKITGSGFPLFRNQGARLQRALINFFLDEAYKAGYEEILPPLLVNEESARATGQLPDKEGQMYHAEKDNLYLIPTAEIPVTNIYRNSIVDQKILPIKLAGYTPCFRREAGSYGSDVKGLNRVHQFDKVEIVQITHPKDSYDTLSIMLNHVSGLLDKLELPYRILRLCGGDIGFTSALTFDFEVYSAGQEKWLEVSSVSNFENFQSNRMKLRFKNDEGKMELAHTLNGSALALARIVAALLENNQKGDGIYIPKALQAYTGFDKIG